MKNLILLFVLFAALFAAIPAEAGHCNGGVAFVPSGFGFVPSFSSRAVIFDNRPIILNNGGGSFERREFRGIFGARRIVERRFN